MAENVMTSIEQSRKLIVRITEILKTVFPQAHVFEATEGLFIRFNPVRGAE